MSFVIGPYPKNRIVLCSADAGPGSQQTMEGEAQYFFRKGRWVGALRNSAERLGCRFVILTTAYGMVNPHDLIQPYDLHIGPYKERIRKIWQQSIPSKIPFGLYDLMVFYAGGCPRHKYVGLLQPILHSLEISLITFGKPNTFDLGQMDKFVGMLLAGTALHELRAILKIPDRLEYYPSFRAEKGAS